MSGAPPLGAWTRSAGPEQSSRARTSGHDDTCDRPLARKAGPERRSSLRGPCPPPGGPVEAVTSRPGSPTWTDAASCSAGSSKRLSRCGKARVALGMLAHGPISGGSGVAAHRRAAKDVRCAAVVAALEPAWPDHLDDPTGRQTPNVSPVGMATRHAKIATSQFANEAAPALASFANASPAPALH